jgi:hypothetical protein
MKTSRKFAPALFLLAVVAVFGFAVISQVGKVMAEGVAQAVEAVSVQASADVSSDEPKCEQREVEADEGYGVSRKEVRLICH